MSQPPTTLDLARASLVERLDALRVSAEELEEAKQRHATARDDAEEALRLLGVCRVAEQAGLDVALVHTLYWDYPEVRADAIARAFGLTGGNEVHRHVGRAVLESPCLDCGSGYFTREVRSRGGSRQPAMVSKSSDWRLCDDCRRTRAHAEAVERERCAEDARARADQERIWLERAEREGRYRDVVVREFATDVGGGSMYLGPLDELE